MGLTEKDKQNLENLGTKELEWRFIVGFGMLILLIAGSVAYTLEVNNQVDSITTNAQWECVEYSVSEIEWGITTVSANLYYLEKQTGKTYETTNISCTPDGFFCQATLTNKTCIKQQLVREVKENGKTR